MYRVRSAVVFLLALALSPITAYSVVHTSPLSAFEQSLLRAFCVVFPTASECTKSASTLLPAARDSIASAVTARQSHTFAEAGPAESATGPVETVPPSAPSIIQNITQPVIERVVNTIEVVREAGLTRSDLDIALNELRKEIYRAQASPSNEQSGSVWRAISLTNKIDQLTGTDITNPAIIGGTITGTPISGSIGSFTSLVVNTIEGAVVTLNDLLTTDQIYVREEFFDGNNQAGTAGQLLSSTGTSTNWIDLTSLVISDGDHGDFTYSGGVATLDPDTVSDSEIDYATVTLADFSNDAGFATATSFDTEAELESHLSDVANVFTNNDTIPDANIAASIARDSELHSAVTLAGTLDYLTVVGQTITRNAIDLATDVTGILGITVGGTGSGTAAGARTNLGLGNVENTALSTWAGSTNLTTLGTVTTGTWQGTAIGDAYLTKSGNWTGSFDGQEGTYYLSRANHTGTQTLSSISDAGALAALAAVSGGTGGTITDGTITSADIAASAGITNAQLANSSVSYGGVTLSLGGSDATPAFNLANATGLPITTGVAGLAAGVASFLGTSSSANLAAALSDETGTGSAVFSAGPTFTGTVNAAAATLSSALTMSGSTANIALGSNYLSGDGGDEGLTVDAVGKVGIGTATPKEVLSLYSANPSLRIGTPGTGVFEQATVNFITAEDQSKSLGQPGVTGWTMFARGNAYSSTTQQNDFGISYWNGTAWNSAFSLDSITGAVGIGTTSSDAQLEVQKSAAGAGIVTMLKLDPNSTTLGDGAAIRFITSSDNTSGLQIAGVRDATGAYGSLRFSTRNASGEGERLRIDQDGNVGIGDTNPTAKLSLGNSVSNTKLMLYDDGIYKYGLGVQGNDFRLHTGSAADDFTFRPGPSASPTMIVKGNGSVGIGTTTPAHQLSVAGTVGFAGLTGATGAGSLCLDGGNQVVYNAGSDACLPSLRGTKHDILSLSLSGIDTIDALEPVSFVYNEGDGRTRFGFIAEDAAAVDDHLATHDASGTISGIDDRAVLAVIVKAFKEMWERVLLLVASDERQNARIAQLESEVAALKSQLGATSPVPSTPPVATIEITVVGNDPAEVEIGAAYSDLGATARTSDGRDLSMTLLLDGEPVENIKIDTAVSGTHVVTYRAADQGVTHEATRTVVVGSGAQSASPEAGDQDVEPEPADPGNTIAPSEPEGEVDLAA